MKGDDWFRADLYRPPEEQSSAKRGPATDEGSGRMLRLLLASVVTLTAIIMLYWLFLVFICDFREIVFPDMPRRAAWLCR